MNDFATAVRIITGSQLSNKEIVAGVLRLGYQDKMKACLELDRIVKAIHMDLQEGYPIIQNHFHGVADKYQIDPAVLYWTYVQWVKDNSELSSGFLQKF